MTGSLSKPMPAKNRYHLSELAANYLLRLSSQIVAVRGLHKSLYILSRYANWTTTSNGRIWQSRLSLMQTACHKAAPDINQFVLPQSCLWPRTASDEPPVGYEFTLLKSRYNVVAATCPFEAQAHMTQPPFYRPNLHSHVSASINSLCDDRR